MNEQLVNKIKQCPSLPSLPSIAMQVLELAQKSEVDIPEIARIISKDAAMSSKILKTVNSSFYGRSQSISTISHALVILGLQSVKTLVLGFSLVGGLNQTAGKGFNHLRYWRHSIYAATAARILAKKIGVLQQEECFLAALLKDIGMLVLDQVIGAEYGKINEGIQTHLDLVKVELRTLGMTHADAAGILMAQWKLPPMLSTPIAFHHNLAGVTDPALLKLTEVIHLAGRCADVFVDEDAAAAIAIVRQFALEKYKITPEDCDKLLEEIGTQTKEVASLFEIKLAKEADFQAILKKANEALVELTLQTQQQASTLQVQNQELTKKATTDALTGLSNRARFDEFLPAQFALARSQNRPLAILMLDMDKFKSVNDLHGHGAGDAVLAYVGRILRTAAREQDLAARYGGEEMVLVLPNVNRAQASARAETIRKAIAARPVPLGAGKSLPVTASFGVAALEPGFAAKDAAILMKAADMALYAAKKGGRNCVRVFSPGPAPAKAAA